MPLDINTPRGQRTLEQEHRAAHIIVSAWRGVRYISTPKDEAAAIDALILREDDLCAVAEVKCRECTLATLRGAYKNEWLVTASKLDEAVEVARRLVVPFWCFVYLVPDDVVLRVKVWEPERGWIAKIRKEKTVTQATVNGGSALRLNAFIDMTDADELRRLDSHDWRN